MRHLQDGVDGGKDGDGGHLLELVLLALPTRSVYWATDWP